MTNIITIACGVILIILIPLLLNCFLPSINKASWLAFWGSYIGGLLTSLIAIFILNRQLRQNYKENESNRQLQISVFQYGQKMALLQDLRKALINYQVSYNFLEIDRIFDHMIKGNYNEQDCQSLKNLIRDVDGKNLLATSIIKDLEESEILNEYKIKNNVLYDNYCTAIVDLLFFNDFIKDIPKGDTKRKEYINRETSDDVVVDNKICSLYKSLKYEIPKSIRSIIREIKDIENLEKYAPAILISRLKDTDPGNDLKDKLKLTIVNLISFEKEKLDKTLKENKVSS
ncbi:hypothetical protein [Segatella paludivivens]|uniref:hypothetical protein n=1 Tax=Segatella paludivivens TaxID=185294 RepID=UPI00035E05C0|nr:hypothetical protein [Segatella paludivivens]